VLVLGKAFALKRVVLAKAAVVKAAVVKYTLVAGDVDMIAVVEACIGDIQMVNMGMDMYKHV
jgi:hypothetical protein